MDTTALAVQLESGLRGLPSQSESGQEMAQITVLMQLERDNCIVSAKGAPHGEDDPDR